MRDQKDLRSMKSGSIGSKFKEKIDAKRLGLFQKKLYPIGGPETSLNENNIIQFNTILYFRPSNMWVTYRYP